MNELKSGSILNHKDLLAFGLGSEPAKGTPIYSHEFSIIKPKIMSSIINKIKNLKLSSDDRILRKYGLEDENGKMTEEAEDLMDDEMRDERWEKRRTEIAVDLRKVEESGKQ